MNCACGGELKRRERLSPLDVIRLVGKPPKHRKRRIRKKLEKRWMHEAAEKARLMLVMESMRPPSFECVRCGRVESFYSAIGRAMVPIQTLPPGGLLFFSRTEDTYVDK